METQLGEILAGGCSPVAQPWGPGCSEMGVCTLGQWLFQGHQREGESGRHTLGAGGKEVGPGQCWSKACSKLEVDPSRILSCPPRHDLGSRGRWGGGRQMVVTHVFVFTNL